MPKISEVCRHVRSKNAGPFWITLDFCFPDRASFERYSTSSALQPAAIGALFGVDSSQIKYFSVPDLCVVKVSYPRVQAQGGVMERDMHGGQQYVRLLDVIL
jgi:hypothetical protein